MEMIPTPADAQLLAFDTSESGLWRSVNDGVMGGLSRGSLRIVAAGVGIFEGEVSLENNGGFASVRATIGPRDLSATCRGRVPPAAPPLDTGRIEQVGLMIADGQQGSFRLQIDWITAFEGSGGRVTN